jgi:hypothetical protein
MAPLPVALFEPDWTLSVVARKGASRQWGCRHWLLGIEEWVIVLGHFTARYLRDIK